MTARSPSPVTPASHSMPSISRDGPGEHGLEDEQQDGAEDERAPDPVGHDRVDLVGERRSVCVRLADDAGGDGADPAVAAGHLGHLVGDRPGLERGARVEHGLVEGRRRRRPRLEERVGGERAEGLEAAAPAGTLRAAGRRAREAPRRRPASASHGTPRRAGAGRARRAGGRRCPAHGGGRLHDRHAEGLGERGHVDGDARLVAASVMLSATTVGRPRSSICVAR